MSVTYDELQRVAELLDEFAAECHKEAANPDISVEADSRWFAEALAYETSAKRLRKVALQEPT